MEFYKQVFDPTTTLPVSWNHQDFEHCTFYKLDLSKTVLSGSGFVDCQFNDCILTGIVLHDTKLYDVLFDKCRMAQTDFSVCNGFGFHVNFNECGLDNAVFLNRNLKKTRFVECSLKETQFLKCDLTGALFERCNLELAKFGENNLTSADFSSSYNLRLDPDENLVRKARFSLQNLPGLLDKYKLVITS